VKLDIRTAKDAEVGEYWIAPFGGVYRRVADGWIGVPRGDKWLDEADLNIDSWKRATAYEVGQFEKADKRAT
jgi:hypothetical protein